MQGLSNDVIALLQYLLPGFVTTWIMYSLTSHERPSQFERIVQALIYSVLVGAIVTYTKQWALFVGRWIQIGNWSNEVEVFWSIYYAVGIGAVISYAINEDWFHKVLRKVGLSRRSSHPSNWHDALSREACYIVLHLKDERRLYGWPLLWPSKSQNDHFLMIECRWVSADEGEVPELSPEPLRERLLINSSDVKWIELIPKQENE